MTRTLCVLCRRKQKLLHLRKLEMTCPQLPLPPQKENTGKLAKHGFTIVTKNVEKNLPKMRQIPLGY